MDKIYLIRNFSCVLYIVFICIAMTTGQSQLQYDVTEEDEPSLVLGHVLDDAPELRDLNASLFTDATFKIVAKEGEENDYFAIDKGDILLVKKIDRDVICPMLEECIINFDIQIRTDTDFYLVKVAVLVIDINDESPKFREDSYVFDLSEAAAVGMTLTLPTALDLDSPTNGIAAYDVTGLSDVFEFNSGGINALPEPVVILRSGLDREEVESYEFTLIAKDSATLPHTGNTRVLIQVTDVNDNSPEYERSTYEVEVDEDLEIGGLITQVVATDVDHGNNAKVVYELSPQTVELYGDLFRINDTTGEIKTNRQLDYETMTEATLVIIARNEDTTSLFSQTRVHVTIKDVNDNAPLIRVIDSTEQKIYMSESKKANEFVAQVTVSDADTGDGGRFDCTLDSNNFELNPIENLDTDFKIKTLTGFDRETQPSYELTIMCNDKGLNSMASESIFTVTLTDENDNSPEFETDTISMNITENVQAETVIMTITATDRDIDENSEISYSLADPSPSFAIATYLKINESSGVITTKQTLDYELITGLQFIVVARDHGNPPRSSTCRVTMEILDQDDNPPVFNAMEFTVNVSEDFPVGAEIARFTATDKDSAVYNRTAYALREALDVTSQPSDFIIDPLTGALICNKSLDRESKAQYTIMLITYGPPPMSLNSSATLMINIIDVNDQAPVILFPSDDNNTFDLPAVIEKDYIIAQVIAEDADVGENARLTYHIVSGDIEGMFALNENTGVLSTKTYLQITQVHTLELHILVTDSGNPKLSNDTYLYIVFNETISTSNLLDADSRGKNENIAILIGVLSGVLVIVLLIAIICLIRHRDRYTKPNKSSRLHGDSVSKLDVSLPYGEGADVSYDPDQGGFVNMALDTSADQAPYTQAEGYSNNGCTTGPVVKDAGSEEGSNADSGHGSHEDTCSNPGAAGALSKWETVFLPDQQSPDERLERAQYEADMRSESSPNFRPEFRTSPPPYRPPSAGIINLEYHPDDELSPYPQYPADVVMTTPPPITHELTYSPEHLQPSWLQMEEYNNNNLHLTDTPYSLEGAEYYGEESPDLYYRHSVEGAHGGVIDLRDFERDHNERYVDEEGDIFDSEAMSQTPVARHLKRRSNSFANDYFPSREYDVYPDHIAGFCTPQPKNVKYCSQV